MEISKQTAMDIALAWREVETAEKLLEDIRKTRDSFTAPDIRDSFGRAARGLELGVPASETSRRCFNVEWALAEPILEAHIAAMKAKVHIHTEKARIEIHRARQIDPNAPCPSLADWKVHNPGDLPDDMANITCDTTGTVIACNVPIKAARQIVATHNGYPIAEE